MSDLGLSTTGLPPVKSWLNITAGSLAATSSTVNLEYSAGPVNTISTAVNNLTPAQIVNGILGFTFAGGVTITLPTAADLDAFVEQKNVTFKTVFSFKPGGGGGVTSATVSFNGVPSFSSQSGVSAASPVPTITLYYYRSNSGWTIYF